MKRIIITGASSGIGKGIAIEFLDKNEPIELWMISRNIEALLDLKSRYNDSNHIIHCSQVDVRDREAVNQWAQEVKNKWKDCQILINNAGLALGTHNFIEADIDDWDTMIDTNVKGLLYTTKAVVPLILNSKTDRHIINTGSTAGKMVYENGHVYCASKYAVDAISQGLRIDLLKYGVKVTQINPGMVDTNFSLVRNKGDKAKADKTYQGYTVLSAENVAQVVYFTTTLPQHVCINDLTVTCLQQANGVYKLSKENLEY